MTEDPARHGPESPESDRDLVERARRDPEAFGVLFDRHYDAIFGYALRRLGEWDLAKDVASETFLKALRNVGRFRWQGVPVSAWLYRIATNEIAMTFRRRRRQPSSLDALLQESGFEPADPKSEAAEREEAERRLADHAEFRRVQRAMLQLRAVDQDVISLRYFERKSVRDIAQILGKKEGTVKSILSRAIDRLRHQLR